MQYTQLGTREQFVLATKFYWIIREGGRHPNTTSDSIIEECEKSLKRLQTDRIDLNLTVAQLAIRWNLTHPAITAPNRS
ncbi:MAG: aldo/keto reductase [Verrucomicrobia bacterium]|nr:aldo/keto reductase [Verrucomicrobiota bacterium]MDA1088420.1 aldo/keto reductase [Verrucomicrobiota bacterium]